MSSKPSHPQTSTAKSAPRSFRRTWKKIKRGRFTVQLELRGNLLRHQETLRKKAAKQAALAAEARKATEKIVAGLREAATGRVA